MLVSRHGRAAIRTTNGVPVRGEVKYGRNDVLRPGEVYEGDLGHPTIGVMLRQGVLVELVAGEDPPAVATPEPEVAPEPKETRRRSRRMRAAELA